MLIDTVIDALTQAKKFNTLLNHFKNKFPSCYFKWGICLIFLFISLATFFLYKSISQEETHSKCLIKSFSVKDKKDLALFFHDLFAANELGYTLFGDKPMSFCIPNVFIPKFSSKDFIFRFYLDDARPLFRGLAVWGKINSKIDKQNYSLIICEEKLFPNFVILINKQSFEKEFLRNIDLFEKYYGKNVTVTQILNNIERKNSYKEISEEPLFYNHVLLGIMLGFGRHNAELFHRREELMEPKIPFMQPAPNANFSSVQEETEYLWQHLQTTNNTNEWFLPVVGVSFAGDPDDAETHALVKKYEALHNELISIFDRRDWLEMILGKLLT
jgi:hypothetical protein